jgi:putative acetyltransferase
VRRPDLPSGDVVIAQVRVPTPQVHALLEELDADLAGPYAADQQFALAVDDLFQPDVRFFLAWHDGMAVACGGVACYDGYAEVKRMYARPAVRGRGVAKALLARLEAEALSAGRAVLRIETGVYQHGALRFYERAGFRRRGPFGPYAALPPRAVELSVFYEKEVGGTPTDLP